MWMNCVLRSGLLFVTLSLAIAKHKQSSFATSCYPRGTLSQAVDTLYVKATRLKATIPVSIRLCLEWWPKGRLKFWINLISLCFIVGRSHKKSTVIKKENKKAIYGKPEGLFLSHVSTCWMLLFPCILFFPDGHEVIIGGCFSVILRKLLTVYLMQFILSYL